MPDFLFDGPNKLAIEPAGSGDTTFDVERDLYSAWKRWVETGAGAQYLPAFSVEGGTPIGATGVFTGATVLLINGWKVRPADHDHQLTLNGNLFSDDGIVSVPALTAAATVFVSATVGAQGVSTSGSTAPTASEVATAVWSRVLEDSFSADEMMRIMASALAGKVAVSGDSVTFRDLADTKDRIAATTDNAGQRTAVTLDVS